MTPINLEDVESYLMEDAKSTFDKELRIFLIEWVKARFAELRAREAAVIRGPPEYI